MKAEPVRRIALSPAWRYAYGAALLLLGLTGAGACWFGWLAGYGGLVCLGTGLVAVIFPPRRGERLPSGTPTPPAA